MKTNHLFLKIGPTYLFAAFTWVAFCFGQDTHSGEPQKDILGFWEISQKTIDEMIESEGPPPEGYFFKGFTLAFKAGSLVMTEPGGEKGEKVDGFEYSYKLKYRDAELNKLVIDYEEGIVTLIVEGDSLTVSMGGDSLPFYYKRISEDEYNKRFASFALPNHSIEGYWAMSLKNFVAQMPTQNSSNVWKNLQAPTVPPYISS